MKTRPFLLPVYLLLVVISACEQAPAAPITQTATPLPSETPAPTRTPLPDGLATEDAARLKMTVQAFQTQTAAEKATERAGGGAGLQPISPENATDLSLVQALPVESPVYGARFSPDGRFGAVLAGNETLVFDLASAAQVAAFEGDVFQRLEFSPHGDSYAAAGEDGTLFFKPSGPGPIQAIQAHTDRIAGITYSPDGKYLLSSSTDNTIRTWDVQSGDPVRTIQSGDAFGTFATPENIRFSPDGQQAAVFFYNDSTLWLGSGESLIAGAPEGYLVPWLDHAGPVANVEISPNWDYLAWISRGTLQLMTIEGEPVGPALHHEDWIMDSAFLPDRDVYLVSTLTFKNGQEEGIVIAYDLNTGASLYTLSAPGVISAFAVAADQSRLMTGHSDGSIHFWGTDMGEPYAAFNAHTGQIQEIAFSPGGMTAASVDADGLLILWDVAGAGQLKEIRLEQAGFFRLAFSSEGTHLAVVTESGGILFYGIDG